MQPGMPGMQGMPPMGRGAPPPMQGPPPGMMRGGNVNFVPSISSQAMFKINYSDLVLIYKQNPVLTSQRSFCPLFIVHNYCNWKC